MRLNRPAVLAGLGVFVFAASAACAKPAAPANPVVEFTIAKRGKVAIELFQKEAPGTVAHFLKLCRTGFYKGILFHRVRAGFVAQAGDPGTRKLTSKDLAGLTDQDGGYQRLGIGGGGSGERIAFERNHKSHEPGTLAMALNSPQSATGDSQFFINLVRNDRLDGDYCVFGRVARGMDVVQRIQQGDRIEAVAAPGGAKPAAAKAAGAKAAGAKHPKH